MSGALFEFVRTRHVQHRSAIFLHIRQRLIPPISGHHGRGVSHNTKRDHPPSHGSGGAGIDVIALQTAGVTVLLQLFGEGNQNCLRSGKYMMGQCAIHDIYEGRGSSDPEHWYTMYQSEQLRMSNAKSGIWQ